MQLTVIDNITDIPATQWNALAGDNPFLSHAFLNAMQQSGCASSDTGWLAQFITATENDVLVGAVPLYLKFHSYGEFVFDWAWADAYQRHGIRYYPKLLCAVPFTPCKGARILAVTTEIRAQLIRAALKMTQDNKLSSFHCLFPDEQQAQEMQQQGMQLRRGVQFHWHNPGYTSFDDYLASLRREKRKNIVQERRKVRDAGITFQRIRGKDITAEHWDFYLHCYTETHRQYQAPPVLNLDFFQRISASMPDNLLLIIASQGSRPVASALDFFNANVLYGRSWGALEYHPALHFETCYYQAIEFCIENNIALFEGGAQGEHKLARGFLPATTWSAHWLAHPEFSRAVEDFLQQESGGIDHYVDELNDRNPFKRRLTD